MKKLDADCLSLIFNKLQNDKKTLFSCLLVSRGWCDLVVPVLWKKYPSYFDYKRSEHKLFTIILSYLPPSSKQFLSDNGIKLPSTLFSKPLSFNYIGFCKILEADTINGIMDMVEPDKSNTDKRNHLEKEIYKLFVSHCKNIKELQWVTSQPLSLFPGAPTCFRQLHSLYINLKTANSHAVQMLGQICKNLNKLTVDASKDDPGLIHLIDSQKDLKSIAFYPIQGKKNARGEERERVRGTCNGLRKVLIRKSNTINDLCLNSVSIIPPSFLTSLVNLNAISIYSKKDNRIDIIDFKKYLEMSEFPYLQNIEVNGLFCFKELAMLIEKTEGDILQVFIENEKDIDSDDTVPNQSVDNTGTLIKAIANNCPKITQLSTYIESKDFIYLESLLLNCRNLVSIVLYSTKFDLDVNDNIGDELLDILIEFSSKSLIDITISEDWKYSVDSFENFFETYKSRGWTLFYFGITYRNDYYITEEHKLIVERYINEGVIKVSNITNK